MIANEASLEDGTMAAPVAPTALSGLVHDFLCVLRHEQEALESVLRRLASNPDSIQKACETLIYPSTQPLAVRRVIVTGIGKAGLIARKVGSTLSSTGTAAVHLHPVEALHGDLGLVQPSDCGILFSYSGETVELIRLARELQRIGCPIVSVTRTQHSTLGQLAAACLEIGDVREACHLNLAPSSSTTAMLAIGDALALAVAKARGFSAMDFGRNHPAGALGQRFRFVHDVMRMGNRLVCVAPETKLRQVVQAVSQAKTGAAVVVQSDGTLVGIFTDGDLRRSILRDERALDRSVRDFASIPCHFVRVGDSLADAIKVFHNSRIEDLPVLDDGTDKVSGLLCLKDIAAF